MWLTDMAIEFAPVARAAVTALHQRVEVALGPEATAALGHALAVVMNLDMEDLK